MRPLSLVFLPGTFANTLPPSTKLMFLLELIWR